MKRGLMILLPITGLWIGIATGRQLGGQGLQDPDHVELPRLIQINVMSGGSPSFTPEKFKIAVGDWVMLSAWLSEPGPGPGLKWPHEFDLRVEGKAIERVATVQPGTFQVTHGNQSVMNFGFRGETEIGRAEGPHVLLRASQPGHVVVHTTVSRGRSWKETRSFEIDVTAKREDQEPIPIGDNLR